MGKKRFGIGWSGPWTAPIFIVLAIVALWLGLSYLPLTDWGINFPTENLWTYAPWLIVFGVALYTLRRLLWSK